MVSIIFLADIVGRPGRKIVKECLPELMTSFSPDIVIANGENSAGGAGIDAKLAEELFEAGVNFITTGNHIWNKREVFPYLDSHPHKIIRPANFPPGCPGKGYAEVSLPKGQKLLIINLQGRIFMNEQVDCPFRKADEILKDYQSSRDQSSCDTTSPQALVFVDFHAETTSEKRAIAEYLDGRVSAVVGTHTHVQTADEQILPLGTGFISDVGMCGPWDSVIGVEKEPVIQKFINTLPIRFEVPKGKAMLNGVFIQIDEQSAKTVTIKRINMREE